MATLTLVHETPSHCGSYRVSSPAEVTLSGVRYRAKDWSAGGFSIGPVDGRAPGERLRVAFCLNFQGFEISFPASAEVVRNSGDSLAAKFVDLGERETELLRSFTSRIISGETTSVENILAWIDSPAPPVPVTLKPESPRTERKQGVRRIIRAGLYLIAGVIVGGFIVLTLTNLFFRLRIDTAVISAALDQMVSQDVGKLAEVFVEPGNRVRAGQPLFRVESEIVMRDVQAARAELEEARIALGEIQARRVQENQRLQAYQAISRDQLELARARVMAATAERDAEKTEFERARKLFDWGLIAAQLFDSQKANLEKHEALLRQVIAEQRIAETSVETANRGSFFSGNFLVGDLPRLAVDEGSARERVAAAEKALAQQLPRVAERTYRAPYDGLVARVFKSAGTTVDRGEALVVLRRTGAEPYIDAYLTQEEADRVQTGTRGTAFIPALSKRYDVQVVNVDRTAGFLKDMQTPRLLQPQYTWRGISDRSAYVKLAFASVAPVEALALSPGLPVHLDLPKTRNTLLPALIRVVHAEPGEKKSEPARAPRLWPPDSPLVSGGASRIADPRFQSVRKAVLDAADRALRVPPAPVQILRSAGATDKDDPAFQLSRRAFEDSDHFALLALAWSLTGRSDYRDAAGRIVQAWATLNQPTGQPIDETRLEGFLWGLDLLGARVDDPAVAAWLERWRAAARAWHFGPKTAYNNHKTHHLKTLLMLDKLLDRKSDYQKDLRDAEEHLRVNLPNADGSSLDYHERDALHYHVFDLEAWEEIALLTGCCGANVDRAFGFLRSATLDRPEHLEFSESTASIDRKRAAAGFEYAQPHPYDIQKAARAIFGYATLPSRRVDPAFYRAAEQGRQSGSLFYEARYYLWQSRE
jgi:multidrug resistance efflux pump